MRKRYLGALILAVTVGVSGDARGQATNEDVAYSALLVGLPVLDCAVFIGGISSAISGTVSLADGRSSAGWRAANYAFAGLNTASTLSYAIAMGTVRDVWPYLLWPMLAHAGLATANFIIGYKVGQAKGQRAAHLTITPLLNLERSGGTFVGVGATLSQF